MAPDRGTSRSPDYQSIPTPPSNSQHEDTDENVEERQRRRSEARRFIAHHASEGQNFTIRGILVGLFVGLVICFSNMYFGLQTGWVSSMSMPSSLIGFAFFKTLSKHLDLPFTPVENVLVQTVAGSMGTMPLGCGFVGVMPALNYMLKPEEGGPLFLSLWKLVLWALGLCFFGVVFAVPLRKQVIIREKLKFPSGTATALMIGVLHGRETITDTTVSQTTSSNARPEEEPAEAYTADEAADVEEVNKMQSSNWKANVKLLIISFVISGLYTLATYFFPILRNLPVFGWTLAESWLWTLNPSLAYVGQGIIMGPATTTHMLLGAIVGWGILSPLAKNRGWAPGPVDDWEKGSKGWIVWVSLAIMLADSVISLGYIAFAPIVTHGGEYLGDARRKIMKRDWKGLLHVGPTQNRVGYAQIRGGEEVLTPLEETEPVSRDSNFSQEEEVKDLPEPDAPQEHLVNNRTVWIGMILSVVFCVGTIRIVFGALVPIYATIIAVLMALVLSIMGVRALGETDLNPVSGISKLAQLFFALIIPQSNKNSVLINLIAGAVSEAGALQAGDLMQDLKTGHLLGAAPNAQFWGQIIGSAVGAVVSALIYRLYTSVYEVPGDLFQVPTGFVWIFTARLVTGKGLPYMAWQWALGAAVIFTATTILRIVGTGKKWHPYIPGGIAVAVGMYNVPSFTLARAIGGFVNWYWKAYRKRDETPIVVLASGLILGEGVVSIVNLLLASASVPHL
ncbi:oligopeptide transporter-like protein [Mollisia scopiformis]|uniref:Oligopeptide transporter-like protein n=1 Tax=Mollisia scopiformis TaxID=149040 RepID=A0A194XTK4_MOLSC|nr:oligopeptide transporter-like protein [Mollisia scopiformis]KUJ23027.1 oligopeptide transporter-like protein [Mollisia scopiformis]